MHAHALRTKYLLLPTDGPKDEGTGSLPFGSIPAEAEDLGYRVELWNAAKTRVEAVLAVTSSATIGFAAYYAAAREHPDRYITLRHKGRTFSGWNSPKH